MRAASLCSGIEGLGLAVDAVFGTETAFLCENDPQCHRVLARHFPDVPIVSDIREIDDGFPEVELLHAGYPCQPFSQAGLRRGADDERHLWPHVARAIRVLRPRVVVLENVSAHLRLGFDDVLSDLHGMGFDAEWGVVRASDTGAPHRRARLFVVASDSDVARLEGRSASDGSVSDDESARRRRALGSSVGRHASPDSGSERLDGSGRGDESGAAGDREDGRSGAQGSPESSPDSDVAGGEAWLDSGSDGGRSRLQPMGSPSSAPDSRRERGESRSRREAEPRTDWGAYEAAIRRWELALGRPAPRPTDDRGRLEPRFVEWMMGFPDGWTEGIVRTHRLRMLGNAVVPAQGELAIRTLSRMAVAA